MTKLFVGGLPYSVTNDELKSMFAGFGVVISATVVTDKFTGQSKGFGFVEMESDEDAQKAIKELDGSEIAGRKIGVSVARPREDRPQRDGGGFNRNSSFGGGGGGGFNNGGGFNRNRPGGGSRRR